MTEDRQLTMNCQAASDGIAAAALVRNLRQLARQQPQQVAAVLARWVEVGGERSA